MVILIISILLFIISIIAICLSINNFKKVHIINEEVDKENQILHKKNDELTSQIKDKQKDLNNYQDKLISIQNNISKTLDNQKELSEKAFENYCEVLENKYKEVEEEHNTEINTLNTAYSNLQLKLMREADQCRADLDKLRASRTAAIEAQRKEKEIKEQLSFYCLTPSKENLEDIKKLERIKPDLHNPRILSMLIWSTFFQKQMTTLCNNVLGTSTVCGIYKITNQTNNLCYIGQSVNYIGA